MYAHKHETGIKSNADEHSTMMLQLVVEFEKVPSFTRLCRFILRLRTQCTALCERGKMDQAINVDAVILTSAADKVQPRPYCSTHP